MASFLHGALIVQTNGIKFSDLQTSGAAKESVFPIRQPDRLHDMNTMDVRLAYSQFLLGHTETPVAARLSPLSHDVPVEVNVHLHFPSHIRIIIYN